MHYIKPKYALVCTPAKGQPYVVLMNSSSKTTVSTAASNFLKNYLHLAAKLADQDTPYQETTALANGSRAIRTAISQYLINLWSPSECTDVEFSKEAKCSNTYSVLPLIAQDLLLLSAPASEAFTERLSLSVVFSLRADITEWTKICK